jgi:hypothetical protein
MAQQWHSWTRWRRALATLAMPPRETRHVSVLGMTHLCCNEAKRFSLDAQEFV